MEGNLPARKAQEVQRREFPKKDPFIDGTVIRYTRILSNRHYNYVAVKANGMWYSSAQGTFQYTWDQFVFEQLAHEHTMHIEVALAFIDFFDYLEAQRTGTYSTVSLEG